MRSRSGLAMLLALAIGATSSPLVAGDAGTRRITVSTPDGPRDAIVVVGGAGAAPRPIVLLFHGHTGSAAQVLGLKGVAPSPLASWIDIARREGLIVASLEGERGADGQRGWNDCRDDSPSNPRSDDVAFARAVVVQLQQIAPVDASRIYAMGMSNGGMMVFRLGLQMPELAAFAAVSASMASRSRCPQVPSADVAALIVSGDSDPLVPFAGGQVGFSGRAPRGGVIAVTDAFARWARAHGRDPALATEQRLPPRVAGDSTSATLRFTGPSLAESEVALARIAGGGHVEPSAAHRLGRFYLRFVGAQNSSFESAELAWEFFRGKRRPAR